MTTMAEVKNTWTLDVKLPPVRLRMYARGMHAPVEIWGDSKEAVVEALTVALLAPRSQNDG